MFGESSTESRISSSAEPAKTPLTLNDNRRPCCRIARDIIGRTNVDLVLWQRIGEHGLDRVVLKFFLDAAGPEPLC